MAHRKRAQPVPTNTRARCPIARTAARSATWEIAKGTPDWTHTSLCGALFRDPDSDERAALTDAYMARLEAVAAAGSGRDPPAVGKRVDPMASPVLVDLDITVKSAGHLRAAPPRPLLPAACRRGVEG
jgi:hypothetical protein